jgi:hypothetical protein
MADIKSIINSTVTQGLTSASFAHNANINNQPHECVIRSINYSGPVAEVAGTYLIRSSLTNGYIGSFAICPTATIPSSVNSNPQTRIYLGNKLVTGQITYTIYTVSGGTPVQYNALVGSLSISMDFIEYLK